jgi:hypothetical protein
MNGTGLTDRRIEVRGAFLNLIVRFEVVANAARGQLGRSVFVV